MERSLEGTDRAERQRQPRRQLKGILVIAKKLGLFEAGKRVPVVPLPGIAGFI
jgi:hypothetical protein